MKLQVGSTRDQVSAAHRAKMLRKAAARAQLYREHGAFYARQLVRHDRYGKVIIASVRPNSGNRCSIWPETKFAKPGRMI